MAVCKIGRLDALSQDKQGLTSELTEARQGYTKMKERADFEHSQLVKSQALIQSMRQFSDDKRHSVEDLIVRLNESEDVIKQLDNEKKSIAAAASGVRQLCDEKDRILASEAEHRKVLESDIRKLKLRLESASAEMAIAAKSSSSIRAEGTCHTAHAYFFCSKVASSHSYTLNYTM
jgi:chromosome segregation ATPase